MANGNSSVTVDTGEWTYIDRFGTGHQVTNAETFNIYVTDGTEVSYYIPTGESVATDDGYTLHFRPETDTADSSNGYRAIAPLTDAGQGSAFYGLRGELCIECPVSGIIQRWKPATITPSDSDYQAAGTIAAVFEDQFGNRMTWASGMNVGQAGA